MASTWFPAQAGQTARAAQINQFLTPHPCQVLYTGAPIATVAAGTGTTSAATWLAQSFTVTAPITSVGTVLLPLTVVGTVTAPLQVSLYTDASGKPGTALATAPVSPVTAAVYVPLPHGGIATGTVLWIVIAANGTSSNGWSLPKGSAASGVSTSTDGVTWAAQPYSIQMTVGDQSAQGLPAAIIYDADPTSRVSCLGYTGGVVTAMTDCVASGAVESALGLTYAADGLLSGATA